VSTKAGRLLKPAYGRSDPAPAFGVGWIDSLPFHDVFDYSYDGILRSFEDSQQRLGLDRIDILLVHDIGRPWHGDRADEYWRQLREGGFRALDRLRSEGAVGAIGLGVTETESVLTASEEFALDCALIAGAYTLLNHAPSVSGAFAELRRRKISIIAGGVFNSGILAKGAREGAPTYDYRRASASIVERVRRIEEICERHHVALASAALRFVCAHPAVSTILLGPENASQAAQGVEAMSVPIPDEFWEELKAGGLIPAEAPTAFEGRM
jgi:D-threo-aldose 1-dehydrogenase